MEISTWSSRPPRPPCARGSTCAFAARRASSSTPLTWSRRSGCALGAGSSPIGPTTKLFALENAPDTATAVSRRLARDEGVAAFAETVQELPEEDRKLVLMYGLEGLSRAEVAARLEVSENAVSKRWTRLKERLRERDLGERFLVPREG